jgi:hypothetical protein
VRRSPVSAAIIISLGIAALASPASPAAATGADSGARLVKSEMASRVVYGVRGRASRFSGASTISYHNGPVMTAAGGVTAYYIWYGAWASTSQAILTDFAKGVGGSPYYGINTTYTDAQRKSVANAVTLGGQTVDTAARGTSLSDATISSMVGDAITSGRLPSDPNGIYFVLTAPGITESSGFLTQYCGWHTNATLAGTDIKFAFVGDAAGPSLGNCAAQTTASPNGDPGADAMVSVVAHELEESATDPDLNAWYDRRGAENADKCAWTFGSTSTASNGSSYNMTLGGRQFLIQRNWRAGSTQGCSLS